MAKFIGSYKAKVDDKGRLIFPSAFKSLLGEEPDLRFVVKKSLYFDCIEMFPYKEWERDSEKVRERLNLFNRENAIFWREYMRGTAVVEPDGKLGRFMIPKDLLDKVGISKEVIFAGNNEIVEVWDKEKYESGEIDGQDFASLAEKLLGNPEKV